MTLARILIVVFLIGAQVLGYPPQGRLMPDGASVPEDAVEHEDSLATASEMDEEYEDDDSDMYMEPESGEDDQGSQEEESAAKHDGGKELSEVTEKRGETIMNATSGALESKDQESENTKESTLTEAADSDDRGLEMDSQHFFPSFAELFANHRLPFTEQQRYRPSRFLGYFQRDRSGYQTAAAANGKDVHHPLLGSGNFGVIRGGTYYPEEKDTDEYTTDDRSYEPYYHGGNHGRANYFRNPKPQPIHGGDFFANFRDFADITAPPKSSFSHLSVVYANKNGSAAGRITEPRNIMETLRMLEEEQASSEVTATTEVPRKKQSKGKLKLMRMKQYEEKSRRSRMTVEPLLALS